jgi:NADH dehydrogenase
MARLVTVFGGSGFVGRHLVRALAKRGWRVRVAVRRPDLAGHLQPLGAVGQVTAVQANIRNKASVERALEGADAVVNLVGILVEGGRQTFGTVQANGPRTIAEAAARAGITTMVHVSAIGADKNSPADYHASKAYGEEGVRAAVPGAVILRPSVIFGPEDQFTNRFASMARFLPVLPLIGGGHNKLQPVFVGDVAEAIIAGLDGRAKAGQTYEIGGPQAVSFKSFLEYVLKETGRRRVPLPIPFWAARIQASFLQVLPGKLLTVDQVTMLESDNVVSEVAKAEKRTLAGLGISPTAIESVAPAWLVRFREKGQFEKTHTA